MQYAYYLSPTRQCHVQVMCRMRVKCPYFFRETFPSVPRSFLLLSSLVLSSWSANPCAVTVSSLSVPESRRVLETAKVRKAEHGRRLLVGLRSSFVWGFVSDSKWTMRNKFKLQSTICLWYLYCNRDLSIGISSSYDFFHTILTYNLCLMQLFFLTAWIIVR